MTPAKRPSGEIRVRLGTPAIVYRWTSFMFASSWIAGNVVAPARARHMPIEARNVTRSQTGPARTALPGPSAVSGATAKRP